MKSKLKTIYWFIKKPQYIPQIFQVLKRKKNEKLENTREEATQWCKDNCISQNEAFKKLTHRNIEITPLDQLFPKELKLAHENANNCPVNMGGEGAISFLHAIIQHFKPKNILETGVAYGWSSLAILLAIKEIPNSKLISNDMPYIKMNNDDYVGCVVPEHLRSNWTLQRAPDIKGIPKAIKSFKGHLDFCHYDSDKSYTGRMWSSQIIWKALKKEGVFISDDINDNIAFKYFCESVNKSPIIIEHLGKYVGIVIK